MIEFQDVTRRYGAKIAVDRLDLFVPRGELFALLGPNGAGKTTTIKLLIGLLRPTSGKLWAAGHDVVLQPREANRYVGYVPDEPHLYDKLTGREFLRFITDMYGIEPQAAAARIEREIDQFQLAEFIDNLTESYSHGMKQRTVFAAALIHDPAILVVDEPMVGLDPHSVRFVKDLLKAKAAAGTTVFMSTHTLAMAEELADRIGIFNQGRLAFLGTVAELRDRLVMQGQSLEALYLELISPRAHLTKDLGSAAAPEDAHHAQLSPCEQSSDDVY